jgi:hypothetical protein
MEAIDSSLLAPNQSETKHRNTAVAKLGELVQVREKAKEGAQYIHVHGTPENDKEVACDEKSLHKNSKRPCPAFRQPRGLRTDRNQLVKRSALVNMLLWTSLQSSLSILNLTRLRLIGMGFAHRTTIEPAGAVN